MNNVEDKSIITEEDARNLSQKGWIVGTSYDLKTKTKVSWMRLPNKWEQWHTNQDIE